MALSLHRHQQCVLARRTRSLWLWRLDLISTGIDSASTGCGRTSPVERRRPMLTIQTTRYPILKRPTGVFTLISADISVPAPIPARDKAMSRLIEHECRAGG